MIFETSITDLTLAINKWNDDYLLGLHNLGATDDKAAWGAGNSMVTVERLPPMQGTPLARVESVNYNAEHEPRNAETDAVLQ